MKAKYLLMAMVVPMAFASCSEDEFVNNNGVQGPNDGRPVVGALSIDVSDVTLNEANSRWTWTDRPTWVETDTMGACLMDTYDDTKSNWAEKYPIVNYISTNYAYAQVDGWSNKDAIMSEGNYFFYLPYNSGMKDRSGLKVSLPTEQYTGADEAGDKSWFDNQMFIGYDDIMVGDQKANPRLVEVFARPRFNINYTGEKALKIERVVLTDNTNQFVVNGLFNPATTISGEYKPCSDADADAGEVAAASSTMAAAYAAYNAVMSREERPTSVTNPLQNSWAIAAATGGKAKDITLNFDNQSANVSGVMLVPAGTHTASDVVIEVYTNIGKVVIDGLSNFDDLEEPADGTTELTYKNLNVLADIKAGAGTRATAIEINFGDKDLTVPNAVQVSTTEQLESVMRWYTAEALNAATNLTVTIVGDDVEFSTAAYNTIKGNAKLTATFVGTLNIPADAANDALALINGELNINILGGTQNLAIHEASQTCVKNLTIAATATLNVSTSATYTFSKAIANNGTLNLNANSGAASAAYTFSEVVTNTGTLDVNVNTTFSKAITNNGTLNVKAGTTTATEGISNTKLATSTQLPSLTIANSAKVVAKIVNNANAKIVNNGDLTLNADSENYATIENNGNITIVGNAVNKENASITNAAGSKLIAIGSGVTFVNEGNIVNNGLLYTQNAGAINNTGNIKAAEGATTYVTSNENGEIELATSTTNVVVNGDKGLLSYVLNADEDLTNGVFTYDTGTHTFNALKIGKNVKFADAVPAHIILTANANITCQATTGSAFSSITLKENVSSVFTGKKVQTAQLTLEEGAFMQIPANNTFAVYTTATVDDTNKNTICSNNGEILLGGNFYANFGGKVPAGTFSSAGGSSYDWNDTDKDFTTTNN